MSAKEMFQKLGYKQEILQDCAGYETDSMMDRWITYSKIENYGLDNRDIIIYFEIYGKSFSKQERNLKYNLEISLEELKAIEKQCEELGWLE